MATENGRGTYFDVCARFSLLLKTVTFSTYLKRFNQYFCIIFPSTLSPRSFLQNARCNRYLKNDYLPYPNVLDQKFLFQACFLSFPPTLSPRSFLQNMVISRAVDFKIQSFFKSESNDSICLKSYDSICLKSHDKII